MSKELSVRGYYIRTYDRDIFITEKQQAALYMAMDNDRKYFEIDGNRIMMRQVKEVVKAEEYKKAPDGGRYCPRHPGNLIPRGKVCGFCG